MEKKAVIIALKPNEIIDILNGSNVFYFKKEPKYQAYLKCYIYCTQHGKIFFHGGIGEKQVLFRNPDTNEIKFDYAFELMSCKNKYDKNNFLSGKVIGEFIYNGGFIDDIEWYEQPKELNEFIKPCPMKCSCSECKYNSGGFPSMFEPPTCNYEFEEIRRPPTPWVYVSELDN